MECPQCNQPLMISDSQLTSDLGSTDVYTDLTLVCINPKCESYAGTDLKKPKKIAKKIKNKVN